MSVRVTKLFICDLCKTERYSTETKDWIELNLPLTELSDRWVHVCIDCVKKVKEKMPGITLTRD